MTSHKERRRARRRAESLMEQAFEAVQQDKLSLATKLSHRSIDIGFVNPRLWLDHGTIHQTAGDLEVAESAFRQAINLAPTFAEAFAALAKLQAERGKLAPAERLQRRVVELCPTDTAARERLAAYTALRPPDTPAVADAPVAPQFSARTERFDWEAVEAALRATGMVRLPQLLDAAECGGLIALWDEECFEHEVLADDGRGRVGYRFFSRPLPVLVAALREEVYARLAPIANAVQIETNRSERFPPTLGDFLDRCARAGQHRTTPILLHYPPGGFNTPHRDIAGSVVFPYQLAITLGPGCGADGDGGALRLVDQRPGKKVHEKLLETAVGDGAVFCSRERLLRVSGVFGLQPVMHGVTEVTRERFALGIPFHEHG